MMRRLPTMAAMMFGLFLACSRPNSEDRAESTTVVAEAPAEQPIVEAGLRWDPPLENAVTIVDDQAKLGHPVRLLGCARAGRCQELLRLETGAKVWAERVSSEGQHAFVGVTTPLGEQRLEIFDCERWRQSGGVALPGLPDRGMIAWTPYDTILYSWGSGTGVADVQLYNPSGELLISASGSWIARAESGRHFALFPAFGTPRGSDFAVEVYETSKGRMVTSYPNRPDTDFVDGLEWTPTELRFDVHSRAGQPTRRETLTLGDIATAGGGLE